MDIKRMRAFTVFLLMMFLAGCLYNNVMEVEPKRPFQGLKDVYQDVSTLNVAFVHGMGHHRFGEEGVFKYQAKIAKRLGFTKDYLNDDIDWGDACEVNYLEYPYFSSNEKKLLEDRRKNKQAICPLKINNVIVGFIGWRQYRLPDNGNILNVFELSWDRATERLQKTLLELDEDYYETVELDDELNPVVGGKDRESDRVIVNKWLKRFVNQRLGDPVIYMGGYRNSIRRVIAEGLYKIAVVGGTQGNKNYSIISDSLGSHIVFDTLGCALEQPESDAEDECGFLHTNPSIDADGLINTLKELATSTSQVFMNANQLPFLALGHVGPPEAGENEIAWLNRFPCGSGGPGLTRFISGHNLIDVPLQIVAFTDPNDALSYHLTKRFRNKCTHLGGNEYRPVNFINVRISNVKWDFGFLANPQKAHSDGFRCNSEAIKLLINGYRTDQ